MSFCDKKNRQVLPFVPNSKLIMTLPLGGKILQGNVILAGTIVVSGGTVNGTLMGEGIANLIKRVIVTATPANGSRYPGGQIVNCNPRSLLNYAAMQHSGKKVAELSGSTLGAGANGTYPIYLSLPIYWANPTLRFQLSTALNTDPGVFASLQVEVDTGDLTSCYTGNNATVNWSSLTLQWADERASLPGDTNVVFMEDHLMLIAASQLRAMDQAMPQDGAFESWLIMQEQGAQATLSDLLLQRVKVDGTPIAYEMYLQDIRMQMIDDEWIDPSQNAAGLAFIDWTDGALVNMIQGGTLQTRFDVTNVSGANLDDLLFFTRRQFAPAPASN